MIIESATILKIIDLLWNLKGKSMVIIGITLVALIVGLSSAYFWKPDNPAEEVSEEVIKYFDNVDINLDPPQSGDKK